VYGVQHPITGKILYPPSGRHWSFGQEQVLDIMKGWAPYELRQLDDVEFRAELCGITKEQVRQDVKAVMLAVPLEQAARQAEEIYHRGQWPIFCFSNNGKGGIRRKTYLSAEGGKVATNFWAYSDVGHTDEAKKELLGLFDKTAPFDTPKPTRLIDRILTIATDKDSIVLDFFSGSATTAHAVMKKNAVDGGRRKFIMVQLPEKSSSPDYETLCDIGKERIRRAGTAIKQEDEKWKYVPLNRRDGSKAGDYTPAKIVETKKWTDGHITEFVDISKNPDIGFRVFKLDDTNMTDVYYSAGEYDQGMLDQLVSNIKPDRTDLDLLFGCLLEWGLPLSMPYISEKIEGCTVHTYNDGDLIACFDENIPETVIKEIAKRQPLRAVFRDSSFADSPAKINVGEIFKMLAPDTRVKVL